MRRRTAAFAGTCAAVTLAATLAVTGAGSALASHSGIAPAPAHAYYLSLGDSLAAGVQPNSKGADIRTRFGYANQLYTALHLGNPLLKLEKLGCPGETTGTMMKGGICKYTHKTQLAQAAAFLQAHAGHVQLVTIDIGANDLNPCLVLTSLPKLVACLNKVIPQAAKNLGTILGTLRKFDPKGKIIGMAYYDPELADWLKGTKTGRTFAQDSIALAEGFNGALGAAYKHFGVPVANVFKAFGSSLFKQHSTLPAFGSLPRDVALICSYTWECAAPPVGPNEHANILGYGVIANTFLTTDLG
jgi:lysophospholipase L1-like esterase